MVRGLQATALVLILTATGCGQEGSDPAPQQTPAQAPSPEEGETSAEPMGQVLEESLTPEECTFPALQITGPSTFPLRHGTVDRSRIQGVSLLLTTSTPTEEPATLQLTRRVVGCVGTATVEVPADEAVSTLGMTLQVSQVTSAIDVPNRAAVTVTVEGDDS